MERIKTLEKGIVYLRVEYDVVKEIPEDLLLKIKNKDPYIMDKLVDEGYLVIVNTDQLSGINDIKLVDVINDDKE